MTGKTKVKVYFKNLDGIRFLAAFMVVVHHSIFFKKDYSPAYPWIERSIELMGRLGVSLFFILSGFLISYLLLVERDTTGTISFRNFYIRRILRIWPLYLGYGLVVTVLSPYVFHWLGMSHEVTTTSEKLVNLLFLFLFAINFQLAFLGDNRGIFEVSWSVCIEEQFYLIWPPLVNFFRKKLKLLIVIMFSTSIVVRLLIYFVFPHVTGWSREKWLGINYEMLFDKLDLFGAGLLIAVLHYHRERYTALFRRIFHPAVQVVMTIGAILFTCSVVRPSDNFMLFGLDYVCDFFYCYVLLAAVADNSIYRLEHPLLRTLGRVSYGIYLFHTSVCQLVLIVFRRGIGHPESRLIYDLAYPLAGLTVTCVVAWLSYPYYERWFLKLK
ncbi:MAG TPA: acyltransferase [Puia sp.]|nr:acyltransferase [Puia sp.]